MMSSGVALLILGFLAAGLGIWAGYNHVQTCSFDYTTGDQCTDYYQIALPAPLAPLSFVITGGGVLFMLIGTVFTAVGYSKGMKEEPALAKSQVALGKSQP